MATGKFLSIGTGFILPFLSQGARADVDVFGIRKLMPSKSPALEWNSLHWAQGGRRIIVTSDPQDPTGWTRKRGQTTMMEVDGAGMLRMGGPQARLYFQSSPARPVFFRDVEVTGYFRRVGTDGASNGGFVVGVRSGQEGHGGNNCLANTYYLAYRYPGTWAFAKELNHPESTIGRSGPLPAGGQLSAGRWIGMKYLAYNLPGNRTVKLEAYIDSESNGNPVNGGTWTKVAEIVDEGNWTAPAGGCGYPSNTVVTTGGGVVFIRNTDAAEANYKMLSFREIAFGTVHLGDPLPPETASRAPWRAYDGRRLWWGAVPPVGPAEGYSDLKGRRLGTGFSKPALIE